MAAFSAGILLYSRRGGQLRLLLAHPGGPFWKNKEVGAWMIPKGMVDPGETAEEAARREFEEELGMKAEGDLLPLCTVRQAGGKRVEAFAMEGELNPDTIISSHFEMEYPVRSGRFRSYPEVDRAAWFDVDEARRMILPSQLPIIDRLLELLDQPS